MPLATFKWGFSAIVAAEGAETAPFEALDDAATVDFPFFAACTLGTTFT